MGYVCPVGVCPKTNPVHCIVHYFVAFCHFVAMFWKIVENIQCANEISQYSAVSLVSK